MRKPRRVSIGLGLAVASALTLAACSDDGEEAVEREPIEEVGEEEPLEEEPLEEEPLEEEPLEEEPLEEEPLEEEPLEEEPLEEAVGELGELEGGLEAFGAELVGIVDPALTLESVSVRDTLGLQEDNIDDLRPQYVDYCFNGPLTEVAIPLAFGLLGFDTENLVLAQGVELNEDEINCVIAEFNPLVDVSAYSLGIVQTGAVLQRDGEVNVQDSEPIAGAGAMTSVRQGFTTAPELVRVAVDPVLDQARFIFNEDGVGAGTVGPEAYGFYTQDGTAVPAAEILSIEEGSAVVAFPVGQLEDAERFFILPGAVVDRQGVPAILDAQGGVTAAPELVSIERNGPAQYDFTFDEAVEAGPIADSFFLYTFDAQRLVGGSVTRPDPNTVRVVFDAAADFDNEVVRGAVGPGAVTALDAAGITNTIGAQPVLRGGAGDQGVTSGPDLLDVQLVRETGEATFIFDETLIDDLPLASGFFLITEAGEVAVASEVVEVIGDGVTGRRVVVLFDEADAQAAVLASVGIGAVIDQQGNVSPTDTVDLSEGGGGQAAAPTG